MQEISDALVPVGRWIAVIAAIIGSAVIGASFGGWVLALICALAFVVFLGWANHGSAGAAT